VASLLVRHFDPAGGRITLGAVDLRELSLVELRRAVCVVEQEAFLFSASVLDNVRYGSASASVGEVEAAVRLAGLEPFIRSLPRGLEDAITEAGRNLSGGQKQRIALARAIVRDPGVLVLDEATSALDSDVEGRIFAGLEDWLSRRTVIVMAHRLSTVARFQRVVLLENGKVAGDGTIDSLLQKCPGFKSLFAEQLAVGGPGGDAGHARKAVASAGGR
jgi:ATP-binding cassette subfamily B protein